MENLTQPTLLLKPFAENGQRNTIPENATGTNLASLDEGFPPVTGQNPKDGGIPPTRLDFNGLGYLTTTYDYFYQAGGCFTFNQVVSDAIGGYPLNARLWYLNANGESSVLRSTKANNTDNFLTDPSVIGDSWVYDVATTTYVKDEINGKITNCITKIPQDIKLELNDGTLTLKAGSKVYVPNGAGTFNTTTTSSDIFSSQSLWGANKYFAVCRWGNSIRFIQVDSITSGSTAPTPTNGKWWYDTTNNKIKEANGTSWNDSSASLPIALVTSTDGSSVASIDQVFNGFGYIGSTVFALPGVKGLISNGRNADGTLNNTALSISNVITTTFSSSENQNDVDCVLQGTTFYARNQTVVKSASEIGTSTGNYYIVDENRFVFSSSGSLSNQSRVIIGKITVSSGNVTSFTPKTAFRAVDYNDAVKYSDFATTKATTVSTASNTKPAVVVQNYRNGTNWYRVWSDGWIEQGGYISSNTTITYLKPFSDTNYSIRLTDKTYTTNGNQKTTITSYSSTNLVLSSQYQTGCWWSCCGY